MNSTETVIPKLSLSGASLLSLLPISIHDQDSVTIYNLPGNLTYRTFSESPIIDVCHQLKHLYLNGDRLGTAGLVQKLGTKTPLENAYLRMCISYTYSLRNEYDKTSVTIKFIPSITKHHPPHFLQYMERSSLTPKELEELKKNGFIASETEKRVTVKRPMNQHEVTRQIEIFASQCHQEISTYLRAVIRIALTNATAKICLPLAK